MNHSAIWPGHRNDKWPGDQSVVPRNLWVGALEAVTTQQGASLIAAIIPPLIGFWHEFRESGTGVRDPATAAAVRPPRQHPAVRARERNVGAGPGRYPRRPVHSAHLLRQRLVPVREHRPQRRSVTVSKIVQNHLSLRITVTGIGISRRSLLQPTACEHSASNSCGARGAFTGHFCGAGHAPIGEPRNNGVFGA